MYKAELMLTELVWSNTYGVLEIVNDKKVVTIEINFTT